MQDKRELSPWLKQRLLGEKLHSIQGKRIGENSLRLTRTIVSRYQPLSAGYSALPLSSPFVSLKVANPPQPSSWGEMTLLLSQPGISQSDTEKPQARGPVQFSQNVMKKPEVKIERSFAQPSVRTQQAAAAGQNPRPKPSSVKAIRGRIEEVSEKGEIKSNSDQISPAKGEVRTENLKSGSLNPVESVKAGANSAAANEVRERIGQESAPVMRDLTIEDKITPVQKTESETSGTIAKQEQTVARKAAVPASKPAAANPVERKPAVKKAVIVSRSPERRSGIATPEVKVKKEIQVESSDRPTISLKEPDAINVIKKTEASESESGNREFSGTIRQEKRVNLEVSGVNVPTVERPEIPAAPRKRAVIDFRPVLRRIFRRRSLDRPPKNTKTGSSGSAPAGGDSTNTENPGKKAPENGSKTAFKAVPIFKPGLEIEAPAEISGVPAAHEDLTDRLSLTHLQRPEVTRYPVGGGESGEAARKIEESIQTEPEMKTGRKQTRTAGQSPAVIFNSARVSALKFDNTNGGQGIFPKVSRESPPIANTSAGITDNPGSQFAGQVERVVKMPDQEFRAPAALELTIARAPAAKIDTLATPDQKIQMTLSSEPASNRVTQQPPLGQVVSRTINVAEFEPALPAGQAGQVSKETLDLRKLARDLYPHIKRMIIIEKERLPR